MSTEPQVESAAPAEPKYRDVIVPIAAEHIREYFTDKSVFFLANHTQSKLRGHAFLTYLANLAVPSDVRFNLPLNQDEYIHVMEAYLMQRTVGKAQTLHLMMAQVLLWAKGVDYGHIPYETHVPEEFIKAFVKKNLEKVTNWLHFVDSSGVFAMASIAKLNEVHKPKENAPLVEDKEYVGHNVVNMYGVPHFTELYFGIPGARYRESYFVHQYEDYMFGNQKLAHYFAVENNFLQHVFVGMATGLINPEDPEAFLGKEPRKDDASDHGAQAPENG